MSNGRIMSDEHMVVVGGDFVGDLASTSQSYDEGQVIVSTGKLNTGYIKMNANQTIQQHHLLI